MSPTSDSPTHPWEARWAQLSRAAGLRPGEPVVVALSGGADSVFLLHLVARSRPRTKVLAVHVDHGLRGEASDRDAGFCARLCAKLGVPFARRRVELDPTPSGLEERAREARYRALADEAHAAGIRTILTGHHEDDVLETLLQRWLRGSALPGLAGLKRRNPLAGGDLTVVRPLVPLRREEVRRVLRDEGLTWCEDASNQDDQHTRNRIRNRLLPELDAACGPEGLEGLRAFARAVESLEEELAERTAHLSWGAPAHAPALRAASETYVGGTLERRSLALLATPLQRRALWRLVHEGTGQPPSRALLERILEDLNAGATGRHSLPGGWFLQLRREVLHLLPPGPAPAEAPRQTHLPGVPVGPPPARLSVPGRVELPDGRVLSAELVEVPAGTPAPQAPQLVELDATDLPEILEVRSPRSGDRFHGLGAPGSRRLSRFLADAGIPREERVRVPLVFAGEELVWVAGLRPSEGRRVRPGSTLRLRLTLAGAAEECIPDATEAPRTAGTGAATTDARGGRARRSAPDGLFARDA